MASSPVVSCVAPYPYPYQVFLNFRGGDIRHRFISHLAKALTDKNINIFIDDNAARGQHLDILFEEIRKSRIALAIFSKGYTESDWCLNELVKINERIKDEKLVTIPIFYMVETTTVKHQTGVFGDVLRKKKQRVGDDQVKEWVEALSSVCDHIGFTFDGNSSEYKFIEEIVKAVLQQLSNISSEENTSSSLDPLQNTGVLLGDGETEIFGLKQRLEELKYKVKGNETRIIGVVGIHGIGKTTLLTKFYEKKKRKFNSHCLLQDIGGIVKFDQSCENHNLPGMVLEKLLKRDDIDEEGYECYKEELLEQKVFIVLDGITSKRQLEVLLEGHRDWTLPGSKIVIATSDKSLLEDLVDDIYVVPYLDYRDGLKHFHHYALDNSAAHEINKAFLNLSKEFVHYVRGHPLTLELLGEELRGNTIAYWEDKKKSLAKSLSPSIRDRVLQVSYDELNQEQKDAFLDIACFRSHDLVYVKSLLDSPGSEETNIVKSLTDKFLINSCDTSLVQMHDLLHTFAKEIGSKDNNGKVRHQHGITSVLQKPGSNVKGLFLDLYLMKREMTLGKDHFKKMRDLRYLKFYSSHCPQECQPNQKIHIPDKLDFPLEEVRCLHWLKYPLDELPHNFDPKNLVDLKLPYSKIRQVWNDKKEALKLKWVDLNHSSKLKTLSGLSKAKNLQRLNLESCTALKTLAPYIQNMGSLIFLNLKGCTALESFPDIGLVPLKTLVLSNCSNLKSFLVISETLEALYLDGTAISQLPTTMVKLVILNLQDCKKLERLPEEFDRLKDLQELVCSGCSILSCLPDAMEKMKCLEILLLDGTAISKIPHISSLERLSLSRNDNLIYLDDMSPFSQLKWLDLKYCKNLLSIPELPTNLQYLDAHGCVSLKAVANPLTTRMPMEQIHSTFVFTNCNKLNRSAKEEITTYAQRKCQFLSAPLKRYNEGFVPEALFSTCFPGCEVPSWFSHQEVGSKFNLEFPAHWNENRFVGIALCAVVSFPNNHEQINSFSVTCKFNLDSKDGSPISFDRLVGRWNNHGNKLDKMESDHVFICYTRCSNNIKCLEGQLGSCIPTTSSLEFGVTNEKDKVEVIKCGLRLVYASEESHKRLMKKDNNDEGIKLPQELTPTMMKESSFNSITSGNLSSPGGNDINVLNEAQSYEESQNGR